jgi:hypothetical protein
MVREFTGGGNATRIEDKMPRLAAIGSALFSTLAKGVLP